MLCSQRRSCSETALASIPRRRVITEEQVRVSTAEIQGQVHQRIAELSRRLHGPRQAADAVAQLIVDSAANDVPGAQYAGITLATSRRVHTPVASHPYPAILDEIQQRHRQGPCLSAAAHQHTVRADDLTTDTRWPLYRRDALRRTPIRSILSFRLFTSDQTMGALNVYADRPHAFTVEAEEIGYVLATHAALAWDAARRENQFQSALASRDMIGQAKGILMARFNISAVAAFELLKRLSQDRNAKLTDIARQIAGLTNFDDL